MYLYSHVEPVATNIKDTKNRPSTAINGAKVISTNSNKKEVDDKKNNIKSHP
jgi:hypothetical protein